jgi:hypothetical protein
VTGNNSSNNNNNNNNNNTDREVLVSRPHKRVKKLRTESAY